MAKIKRIMTAGPLTIESIHPAYSPRDSEPTRQGKRELTTQAMKMFNLSTAKQKLELQLAANIRPGDLTLELTYTDDRLPETFDQANRDLRAFIRKLRRRRKKEWCWFARFEWKTAENQRFHFHVHMTRGPESIKLLNELWGNGKVYVTKIVIDQDNTYRDMAEYMTKESVDRVGQHLWQHSRGLKPYHVDRIRVPDDEDLVPPDGCMVLSNDHSETVYGSYRTIKYMVNL